MEKKNENASAWIAAAEAKGLDVRFLYQDKTRIFDFLDQLGLPRPISHLLPGEKVNSAEIDELFDRFPSYFCRLIPKDTAERKYKPLVCSAQEFREFCSAFDMSKYTINLVQKRNVSHTGSIIAADEATNVPGECIVELLEGDGPDLFHGHMTPVSAKVDLNRVIRYSGIIPTEEEKMLVLHALKLVGGPRHPFPGYYEFEVWDRQHIIFRNYQGNGTAYADLKQKSDLPTHPGD